MAKDVLITPASGLIEFKDNEGNVDSSIQLNDSNVLVITGTISLGDLAADVYIGDGVNEVDIVYEQDGGIYGLAGKTLTLGLANSYLSLAANITSGANITGNVTGGNILTAGLISAAGNVSGGNLNVTGNIVDTGALTIITGSNGNIALAPNGTGIVTASGNLSAVGNISGSYILGNGSQLTGLPSTYANANVAAYLASGTDTSNIITTANVSGGNVLATTIVSGASHIGSIVSVSANVTGGNLLTGGLISATSTITSAANVSGGNVLATTIVSGASHIGSIVSVSANVTGGNLLTGGIISATGNVSGGNVAAATAIFSLGTVGASGNITGGNLLTSGIVSAASHIGSIVSVSANVTGGNLVTAGLVSATGNVSGNYFIGNGSQLTGISASSGGNLWVVGRSATYYVPIISGTLNIVGRTGNISVPINS